MDSTRNVLSLPSIFDLLLEGSLLASKTHEMYSLSPPAPVAEPQAYREWQIWWSPSVRTLKRMFGTIL